MQILPPTLTTLIPWEFLNMITHKIKLSFNKLLLIVIMFPSLISVRK